MPGGGPGGGASRGGAPEGRPPGAAPEEAAPEAAAPGGGTGPGARPRVQVLLAAKDGAAWLPAQLGSLAAQRGVDLDVLAADDGSADGTADVLRAWTARPLALLDGHAPAGLPGVFLDLLDAADPGRDAWAFCDQDDVWEPGKLAVACAALAAAGGAPALWVCRVALAGDPEVEPARGAGAPDGAGSPGPAAAGPAGPGRGAAALVHPPRTPAASFGNALVESVGPGCAMVWNDALRRLLRRPDPAGIRMHDAWLYLVASALGRVLVEPAPLVRYRVHPGQSTGVDASLAARARRHRAERAGGAVGAGAQAAQLLAVYGDALPPDRRALAAAVAAPGLGGRARRVAAAATGRLRRRTARDQALLVLRSALG